MTVAEFVGMSDAFWTAAVQAVPAIIAALTGSAAFIAGLIHGYYSRHAGLIAAKKAEELKAELQTNTAITEQVKVQTNGRTEKQDAILAGVVAMIVKINARLDRIDPPAPK